MSVGSVLEKQAARYSKKPLILFEGRTITYKDFNESANQYANFFKTKGLLKEILLHFLWTTGRNS